MLVANESLDRHRNGNEAIKTNVKREIIEKDVEDG